MKLIMYKRENIDNDDNSKKIPVILFYAEFIVC